MNWIRAGLFTCPIIEAASALAVDQVRNCSEVGLMVDGAKADGQPKADLAKPFEFDSQSETRYAR